MTDQPRKTLRLNMESPQDRDVQTMAILVRSIEARHCASWMYNHLKILAAPQILYRRNDNLYCDAVVIQHDGKAPREEKLGTFRLAGMTAVKSIARLALFWPHRDLANSRYGSILFVRDDE
ncbi:hypothetical protein GS397_13475 [Sphingobium yanoikuyae]|uniref:Uncharacterized protein n=1 Tax=Sphingobium yanoikuyae TaxID=13690 RepID=A0A6P1GHE5_SPHYA|nr:hypothetical protein [Sphingobium yanoikuyae]QHD67947.1 hypothetical protein GS397_13475 [Sphingobium yanoikuyae]